MFGAVSAFLIGAGIYYAIRNPKFLRSYERSFAEQYRLTPKIAVPLNFDEVDKTDLLNLCAKYVREKRLKDNPPSVETHWLGFQTVAAHPVRIELIRCTNKLAIIQGDGYLSAYLLQKTKKSKNFVWKQNVPNQNFRGTLFRIKAKFIYGQDRMQKMMVEEMTLIQNTDASSKDREQMIENITRVARPEFFEDRAGHEVNQVYPPARLPNHYTPTTYDAAEVIPPPNERPAYYPPYADDSPFRSQMHPLEDRHELPKY